MRIYFTVDERNLVHPCRDYRTGIIPESDWLDGEISGNAYEEHGIPLWKYENSICVRRTVSEVQADIDALPIPEPTESDQLRADIDYLTMENEALESESEQARADIDYLLMLT